MNSNPVPRRQFLRAAAGAAALSAVSSGAWGQAYPTRPITMIVPFAAGGPSDAMARVLGDGMHNALGQPVIIEDVVGASGSIGVGRVVHAPADGYTVGIGHWSTHVINGAIYDLHYDLLNDLQPVALLPSNPEMVVSRTTIPATNLRELIAWLKANEATATAGTAGSGSATHIGGVFFEKITGTHLTFVPYRGTGPAINDLIAGQIDVIVDQSSNCMPQVKAGTIRAYAVAAKQRLASAPDIPTVDEAGAPGLYVSVWYGLWVPRGTPRAIVDKLNAAVVDAMANPAVRTRMAALGLDVPPRDQQTPEALHALQKAEIEKWWPIIKAAGIQAE